MTDIPNTNRLAGMQCPHCKSTGPGDGVVGNCGQFLKEPCSLCHTNPRCCGIGSSVWRLSLHGPLLLKVLLLSE